MIALSIKNLTKRYPDIVAVKGLTLDINEGELFSLLGVNGAGKSTTIKMLTCLIKPDGGDAELLGNSIVTNYQAVKQIVNLSPQETAVAPNLSVRENIEFIAEIYGVNNQSEIDRVIEEFALTEYKDKRAGKLSGGWQRRLSIAMALVTSPKILFLDEPTLGLDVLARRELWQIIKGLKGKMTIILTTHYMEEAEMLSDRIGVMAKGELLAIGAPQELMDSTNSKSVEDAFVKIATGEIVL